VPLLIVRLLLGGMFIWMGAAKTGYPELILKKTGHWTPPAHGEVARLGPMELGGSVNFLKLIREYDMFPSFAWPLMNLTAVAMPWVEVLCGVMLVLGVGVRGAAGLLFVLLIMFTTMIVFRGLHIYNAGEVATFCEIKFNCGCGGGDVFICHKIPENLMLTLLSVIAMLSGAKRFCLLKNIVSAGQRDDMPVPG
jgi:uncharacterized membrane protein YphA (DoxX/SURF4 family)